LKSGLPTSDTIGVLDAVPPLFETEKVIAVGVPTLTDGKLPAGDNDRAAAVTPVPLKKLDAAWP
jgi:hypothetical protein